MNKKSKKAILIGLAAAAGYSFIKGKGIFNKPRFYHQHKAMEKYLETNHPNAIAGEIVKTSGGYTTIVNDGGRNFVLNITRTEDNTYIFSEEEIGQN